MIMRRIFIVALAYIALPTLGAAQIIENLESDDDYYYGDYDYNYDYDSSSSYDDYSYSDDYYDENGNDYYNPLPCSHGGGAITGYSIVRIREGMASWEKPIDLKGVVLMSGRCIEISCGRLEMWFAIAKKEVASEQPKFYKLYREHPDEICDYIEFREAFGRDRGCYYLMLGRLNTEKHMEGTMQITVRPMKISVIK